MGSIIIYFFFFRRGNSTPSDSAVTLAFACMLLNTDLHAPGVREDRRMSLDDFVSNLRGVDGGADFDARLLRSVYRGVRKREFCAGADHVAQTRAVERSLQGEGRPARLAAEHHRRLVCLCRLYEVVDLAAKPKESKKDKDKRENKVRETWYSLFFVHGVLHSLLYYHLFQNSISFQIM